MIRDKRDIVLFVDDEEVNLFLLEKRFEHDFKVLTATSGNDGLFKIEKHADEIKVVISDMRMPEMSGLDFIKIAKKRFPKINYYILTGYEFNNELSLALENKEINRIFKKPYDYEDIKHAIGLNS